MLSIGWMIDICFELLPALPVILLSGTQLVSAPTPRFSDYPVKDVFRGRPASPVLASDQARRFRTELRKQSATGPNFAGHFALARWGCGAGCVMIAIVDAQTGHVWFPKLKVEDAVGADGHISLDHAMEFQLSSELLVAQGRLNEQQTGTGYFRWHDSELSIVRFDALTIKNPEYSARWEQRLRLGSPPRSRPLCAESLSVGVPVP